MALTLTTNPMHRRTTVINSPKWGELIQHESSNYAFSETLSGDSYRQQRTWESELRKDPLTYRQIARDIASLVSTLALENVKIIGFSDDAIDPVLVEVPKAQLNAIEEKIATNDKSKDWEREKQQQMLTLFQPNISTKELASIKTPILLIAGDRDLIANFHTVEIFESLPNAHLAILPNETHFTPVTNPDLFNSHVDKFFDEKFYRSNWLEAYSQLDQ